MYVLYCTWDGLRNGSVEAVELHAYSESFPTYTMSIPTYSKPSKIPRGVAPVKFRMSDQGTNGKIKRWPCGVQ